MQKIICALMFMCCANAFAQKKIVVDQNGGGDFKTVQAAFDAIPAHNTSRVVIYVKNGTYHEKLRLDSGKNFVELKGESGSGTILTYDDHPGKVTANGRGINTQNSYTFQMNANDFYAHDITFRNDAGFTAGQAVALEARGDRAVFINCRITGNQDILFLNSETSRQYYKDCYIEGTTDFIFGAATAWFESCHIHSKKNSHITAASTPQSHPYGFIFNNCTLTGDTSLHSVSLGRPWRPYSMVVYMHCNIGQHVKPEGWSNWNQTESYKTARYAEYQNYGPGGSAASRVSWSKQLTSAEANNITLKNIFPGWDPQNVR
ncbi:pectin esterase [Mucilaginibacter sp. HMF5004]|uniref:pectinesterase family protein n=1 Tax=Mucilaginibacter rivuli TaxID=2857527 RepID=UPI001C5EB66C|nr:pectinesterase family protein [Mucilaginibacter rivuli]MBW4888302.1 pectin esterase [Mucilaginibacter rivuli]